MHRSQLVNRLKIVFLVISAITIALIGYLNDLKAFTQQAQASYAMAILLALAATLIFLQPKPGRRRYLDWIFFIILTGYILHSAHYGPAQSVIWMYFFPLSAFFLFSLRRAIYLTLMFTPISLYISLVLAAPLQSVQVFFGYIVIAIAALFLAMVKSRTNALLEPLISSDEETGAQLENKLTPALTTEINRAEREGTGLLLMRVDLSAVKGTKDMATHLIQSWANTIRQELRPFDQYYRLKHSGFAIILPHMNTEDGEQLIAKTFSHLPEDIRKQVKIGLASLNVGDTAESLINDTKQDMFHV